MHSISVTSSILIIISFTCLLQVSFPESVKWMTVEFDNKSGTAQVEDTLQLLIPAIGYQSYPNQSTITRQEGNESFNKRPFWPVHKKFSCSENWPRVAIVIPGAIWVFWFSAFAFVGWCCFIIGLLINESAGNEIIFLLETATDYVKNDKACFYGFKCNVVGYEWAENEVDGLKHLEKELSYIGGMCASSLMKKDLLLPPGLGFRILYFSICTCAQF